MGWIKSLFKNTVFQIVCQVILIFSGFIMIALQVNMQYFEMGSNPWNARLYGIIGTFLISIGTSVVGSELMMSLKRFLITTAILFGCWTFVGGFFVLNDISAGTNYTKGSLWVGFDALSGTLQGASVITNAVFILLIIGILITAVLFIVLRYKDKGSRITTIILIISAIVLSCIYFFMRAGVILF